MLSSGRTSGESPKSGRGCRHTGLVLAGDARRVGGRSTSIWTRCRGRGCEVALGVEQVYEAEVVGEPYRLSSTPSFVTAAQGGTPDLRQDSMRRREPVQFTSACLDLRHLVIVYAGLRHLTTWAFRLPILRFRRMITMRSRYRDACPSPRRRSYPVSGCEGLVGCQRASIGRRGRGALILSRCLAG